MARLNVGPRPVLNNEGVKVTALNPELALRRSVMSCLLWEREFYEDGEAIVSRIRALIPRVPAETVAAIAVEARERMKLRHMPLFLVREMARLESHRQVVAKTLAQVIQRPDELSEFVALYWKDGRRPLSAQVKKGLAAAFTKFNEYQLAKWNRDTAVKLRDVLFLSHAKPKDEEQDATWKKLVAGTLPTPDTWEVALSGGANKREAWERLLKEGKLGAMAILRNLRNMTEAGVDDGLIREALRTMNTERVLPFRFISAARYAPRLEPELEAAMYRCLAGSPRLRGRTALVIDTSPSMWQEKVSARSEMDRFDAAAALAILAREVSEEVAVYAFNQRAYEVPPRRGFALRDALAATKGNASRGGLAVQMANEGNYDRIIVLTDGQWHPMTGDGYGGDAVKVSPEPKKGKPAYMVNVSSTKNGVGYGRWTSLDGWSEAIVDYILASEGQAVAEPSGDLD